MVKESLHLNQVFPNAPLEKFRKLGDSFACGLKFTECTDKLIQFDEFEDFKFEETQYSIIVKDIKSYVGLQLGIIKLEPIE